MMDHAVLSIAIRAHLQCDYLGYYCAPNQSPHTGGDIVFEQLRQMCLFQEANTTFATDYGVRYWKYATGFYENCMDQTDLSACSVQQQIAAGAWHLWMTSLERGCAVLSL